MGVGASAGAQAAEKLVQAVDKLKLPEISHNITDAIKIAAGPIELKINLDVSDSIEGLTKQFILLITVGFGVFSILILFYIIVINRGYSRRDERTGYDKFNNA
jgi:hypothetical protein